MNPHDDSDPQMQTPTPTPTSEGTMPSTELSASAPTWLKFRVPIAIAFIAAIVLFIDVGLTWHHESETNHLALASLPKGVTVVTAKSTAFHASRRYVGTVEPWLAANVGPQFTSAYIGTVLVRPGDAVKRGAVVATLDCRNASAQSSAVQMRAKSVAAEQEALAHRASRMSGLVQGGFVSSDELEKQTADSDSKAAELLATQAQLQRATLEVDDCVLRAPFDGEVSARFADPGSFARPGMAVVTIVDRHTVRIVADVPEADFADIAPATPVKIHLLATGADLTAPIARRSPSADADTRDVHIEIDVDGADRRIPVGTTAVLGVDIGDAKPAVSIPLAAATIRAGDATLFVVDNDKVAHKKVVAVVGEKDGFAFLDPSLGDAAVVLEGRTTLLDKDRVAAVADTSAASGNAEGGKTGGAVAHLAKQNGSEK